MSYHKVRTKQEIIADIFFELHKESIKHLKKNKLGHLTYEILFRINGKVDLPQEVNPFDITEDLEPDNIIKLKSFDEMVEMLKSKDKIKWFKERGIAV